MRGRACGSRRENVNEVESLLRLRGAGGGIARRAHLRSPESLGEAKFQSVYGALNGKSEEFDE